MSIYLQFIKLNNQSNSIPHDLIILRPATHSEVLLIDKNYKSIQSSSKISCPCILLMGRNTMIIGFPPILIAGLQWKNEIPNLDDWMNLEEMFFVSFNFIYFIVNYFYFYFILILYFYILNECTLKYKKLK